MEGTYIVRKVYRTKILLKKIGRHIERGHTQKEDTYGDKMHTEMRYIQRTDIFREETYTGKEYTQKGNTHGVGRRRKEKRTKKCQTCRRDIYRVRTYTKR